MVIFIVDIFNKLKNNKLIFNILIETVAGQSGEMCYNLNDFVNFIQRFKDLYFYDNIGVVIDTCHIFQAGYDLNNDLELKKVHKIFSPIKNKIKLIHLNDSYHEVGRKIDRHEQLGKGKIKINSLIKFIKPYINVPMILETSPPYDKQISLLDKNL
jgi:endonuclease IV